MTRLLEQVEQAIRAQGLLRKGQRLLVAVSGGLDSVVLLHVLSRLAPAHGWRLVVAHFNHQLRGRSSEADERFVQALAARLGWPCVTGRADVQAFSRRHKLSLEMAARELRHRFLARTARRLGLNTVALAHQADDQVELFFLRLLRGAGPEGLAGMKWQSPSPADAAIRVVRPLLGCARREIAQFARQERLAFREDASNRSRYIQRNRLRHDLLPHLARHYQPALARTILRVMDLLRAEADFVAEAAAAWLRKTRRPAFARLPVAVQRQVLQRQLSQTPNLPMDFELIEALRLKPGTPVTVRPGLALVRDDRGLLHRRATGPIFFNTNERHVCLSPRGACEFDGLKLAWRVASGRVKTQAISKLPGAAAGEGREQFDADKVGRRIVLRHWRPGDRFQPIGLAWPVKLQDWFTNRKVPRAQRHQVVVAATAAGEIFWVEGQRIADGFKLEARTTRRLVWTWRRDELGVCGPKKGVIAWPDIG